MKTLGTLVTVLLVFFALVCLSPAMAQYNYEIYLRPGGSLNGQSINTSNPVINVSPGENLSGTIKIQHIKVHSSDIVPLIYTPNWGNHSTSYNGVAFTSQGTHNFDVSINNLQAPTTPGTYLIIFASAGRYTYGQVAAMDSCNCADLTKSDLPIALSEGVGEVRTRDCNTSNYGHGYAGITYVEINVSFSAPVPDIKANGVDESLTISSTENIKITISLASGDREGITSDCWISADTPFGLYWYILESQDWNWKQSDTPILTAQFPLTDVIEFPVFDSTLTDGHYTFNFAVDDNADGLFDKTWFDSVELYVVPHLEPVDDEPLGNRTPLILVHGNNSETKDQYRWGDFIEKAQDSDFAGFYKMYLFRWDSNLSNKLNGLALGCSIDNEEDLHNREVVILAHSRGGIVSRCYMNDYVTLNGDFSGQPGGEHVKYLVTLATPHRGTPGADLVWSIFSFDYNYSDVLSVFYAKVYLDKIYNENHIYLQWDDVDNELTDEIVCWNVGCLNNNQCCVYLQANQTDLLALNQQESYLGKIIAYGGNEFDGELSKSEHEKFISKTQEERKIEAWCEHPFLSILSVLMADMPVIPNGYPGNPIDDNYRRFQANDGMVPLDSALLLKPGSGNLFHVENGNLVFDEDEVRNHCQVNECNIIVNRQTDHMDFLDDDQVIDSILNRLKTL
jgi:hypothetical protein